MSGEREGDRQAIDNITADILKQNYKPGRRPTPEQAQDMARGAMREADRRLRESGKR